MLFYFNDSYHLDLEWNKLDWLCRLFIFQRKSTHWRIVPRLAFIIFITHGATYKKWINVKPLEISCPTSSLNPKSKKKRDPRVTHTVCGCASCSSCSTKRNCNTILWRKETKPRTSVSVLNAVTDRKTTNIIRQISFTQMDNAQNPVFCLWWVGRGSIYFGVFFSSNVSAAATTEGPPVLFFLHFGVSPCSR